MEWWVFLILFFTGFLFLLAIGLPVAFSFLLINGIVVVFIMGTHAGPYQMTMNMFQSLTLFTLAPVPLFILLGEVLFHSGMALRALDVLSKLLGRLPGRLSILANLGGTIFAALSGSPMANTAMLGSLLVPEMEKRGYSRLMTIGPIMAAGGIAMIIPPSTLSVIYGTIAEISIAKLLIAGVIPGLIMGANYMTYIIGACLLKPELTPDYEMEKVPAKVKLYLFFRDVFPLSILMFLVLGLIFLGIATPTESAAVGVLGAFIQSIFYGGFSWEMLKKVVIASTRITGMIFLIVAGSMIFSQIMAFTGTTKGMTELIVGWPLPTMLKIIAMLLMVFFLGIFVDQVSIMMITVPLFVPVVEALGVDPFWFAIIMLIDLEIALTTPPFGVLLFIMKGVAPKGTTMTDIYSAVFPFVLCDTFAVILVMVFPALALWLPSLML
ncbi:MAG: TRAP transporter large permease subunit [Desulfobacteraceae bacterium]|jgi:tripartite ATP-independent transporter DctM subunit